MVVRSDFQEVESVAVQVWILVFVFVLGFFNNILGNQHLVEKDKLALEIKSMTETIARFLKGFCS
jgi:hypothetical protein